MNYLNETIFVYPKTGAKSIKYVDTTDYAGQGLVAANVVAILKVTGPNGTIYQNTGYAGNSFSSPDLSNSNSMTKSGIVPVPLDSYDNILTGNYTIDEKVRYSDSNTVAVWTLVSGSTYTIEIAGDLATRFGNLLNGTVLSMSLNDGGGGHTTTAVFDTTFTPVYDGVNTSVRVTLPAAIGWTPTTFVYQIMLTTTDTYAYCFTPVTPCITQSYSCYRSELQSLDSSSYSVTGFSNTLVSREHRVKYPVSMPTPLPDIVSSDVLVTVTPIWTKTWTTIITSNQLYESTTDGYFVDVTYYFSGDIDVSCDTELCNSYDCISNLYNQYTNNLSANPKLAAIQQDQITQLNMLLSMYNIAVNCGNPSEATSILNNINALLKSAGCTCGCAGSNGTVSEQVIPLYGSTTTVNANVTVSAGTGITITATSSGGLTVYTINVDLFVVNSGVDLHHSGSITHYTNITDAIDDAVSGDMVVVHPGTYTDAGFYMPDGITFVMEYGAYWSTTSVMFNNLTSFKWIGGTISSNSSSPTIDFDNTNEGVVLDFIKVINSGSGNAINIGGNSSTCDYTLNNCLFKSASGNGIYVDNGTAQLFNCKIQAGVASNSISNILTGVRIYSCYSNRADAGGAAYGSVNVDSGLLVN